MDDLKAYLKAHPHVSLKQEVPLGQVYIPTEWPKGYVPYESEEQAEFVRWLSFHHPDVPYFAVPNGGKRSKREAAEFERTGVKGGVPDLVICESRGGYHGLFIEMKRTKNSKISDDQILWRGLLEGKGYRSAIAYGAEEAKKSLLAYLALGPFKI